MSFLSEIRRTRLFSDVEINKTLSSDWSSTTMALSISTAAVQDVVERLKFYQHRSSTRHNYYGIWKNFNDFFIKLDNKPDLWEDRITLFVAYLIDNNRKSTTVRSYISTLQAILKLVGVKLNQDSVLLGSLTRACKLCNDQVSIRLPVRRGLLGMLIGAVDILYGSNNCQPYLSVMYKALFSTAYFGLFRVGELMMSPHVVKAVDVHIGTNKDKLMFILHTSKTHNRGVKPQIIKIDGEHNNKI